MQFSSLEVKELLKAWTAVSLAFALLYSYGDFFSSTFLQILGICAVIVGSGFLLHELAHKYLAQKYGCWAEFRADNKMLLFMLAVSFFGFIFAAPGGVYIHGALSRERHGKISLAGPMVNLALGVFFFVLIFLGVTHPLVSFGLRINSWLAVFNLLPFWQLDGLKVLQWHKGIYVFVFGAALILSFLGRFAL